MKLLIQREGDEISWAGEEAKNMYDHTHEYTGGWTRRRIVTYNVNSLVVALARAEGRLLRFIDNNRADVYAFQETMVDTSLQMKGNKWKVSPFCRRVKAVGYHAYWHAGTRSRGGYGSTLFLSLVEPECVVTGTGDAQVDSKGRFQALVFADPIVVNTYVPTLSLELKGKQRKTDFWKTATVGTNTSKINSKTGLRCGSAI
jgi:exonuclease III